eukprot:TRINITY_DN2428_c0_g1_i4.p1 TRINITY_DN2428_c0_g1~~TRINITY_DN2428_c0_g1_i4.p1  ORF type:complete len:156 (+),score=14.77 TRINITY_DN2428_c0_g1_i4:189-656(+)
MCDTSAFICCKGKLTLSMPSTPCSDRLNHHFPSPFPDAFCPSLSIAIDSPLAPSSLPVLQATASGSPTSLGMYSRCTVLSSSCVVVEDSHIGLTAAKAAGMTCVVTKSGYTGDEDFSAADAVFDAIGENAADGFDLSTLTALVAAKQAEIAVVTN